MYHIESSLQEASVSFEHVRDAMAAVSAQSMVGSAAQLTAAAAALEKSVADANGSSRRVRRLLHHLGVGNMSEAAALLCDGGRPEAARRMMRLHTLATDMRRARTGIDSMVNQCLHSIHAAQGLMRKEATSGRLIGSA